MFIIPEKAKKHKGKYVKKKPGLAAIKKCNEPGKDIRCQLVLSLSIRGLFLPSNANGQDQHDHHDEHGNFRVVGSAARDSASGAL